MSNTEAPPLPKPKSDKSSTKSKTKSSIDDYSFIDESKLEPETQSDVLEEALKKHNVNLDEDIEDHRSVVLTEISALGQDIELLKSKNSDLLKEVEDIKSAFSSFKVDYQNLTEELKALKESHNTVATQMSRQTRSEFIETTKDKLAELAKIQQRKNQRDNEAIKKLVSETSSETTKAITYMDISIDD